MNRINPQKLQLSKWTARIPRNREKHFLVTELFRDDDGKVLEIELQAVMSGRNQRLPWQALQDEKQWRQGWKTD